MVSGVLVGMMVACASTPESSGSGRSGDITRDELELISVNDAMEAVMLLRPQWLRARPSRTPGSPVPVVGVVIDGRVRTREGREELAQIPVASVERMRFLSAADATIRYGTGFTGGAIVVTTRR